LMTILGIVAAGLLAAFSPVLVKSILKIESTDINEFLKSFYIISIGVPFTVVASGLRGVLEALLRFDIANSIRAVLGVFNFLGPVLVMLFTADFAYAVAVLVLLRILCLIAYVKACWDVVPGTRKSPHFDRSHVGHLFKFGSWITVSNLISPVMVSFDRFFLGAMVSVSALAYYSIPWEVMARLLIIPAAFAGVIFPVFSEMKGSMNIPDRGFYYQSLKYVLLIMFPICLIGAAFAKEILSIWMGHEFAASSFRVMQIMSAAVLLNGLAMIPFSFIQASGRPDITAKYHVIEFVIYVPLLWLLIREWTIVGAALAWLIRVALDLALLLGYSTRRVLRRSPEEVPRGYSVTGFLTAGMILGLAVPPLLASRSGRIGWALALMALYGYVAWTGLLGPKEKRFIAETLGRNTRVGSS
jgi:O-antigen/teichoic acid export membrane protein